MREVSINTQSSIKIGDIYFDPFEIHEPVHDASVIFVTHTHYDHFDVESINNVKKDDTYLVIVDDDEYINKVDFDENHIIRVKPNNSYKVLDYDFYTVPSYNLDKIFHKKEYNWVGYVVIIDNETYYIMGDTDPVDEAYNVKCDYLFVPIGGYYTMNFKQASKFTNEVKPKEVFPIHYGSIVGDMSMGEKFRKMIDSDIKVNILIK
ncbi:MAG: MBL fold metallo-hydrolase [Bacilli bacterium]|nr:MBL fold metallo-hydrolase [Bacilli bacterium]